MRKALIAAVVATAAASLLFALPALGGPSPLRTAKKALRVGKKALRVGKKADRRARTAQQTASRAEGKADSALARPSLTPSGITTVQGTRGYVDANGLVASAAVCPSGYRVISGGGSVVTGAGGIWATQADSSRTAWYVLGEDLAGQGGYADSVAYCARAGGATVASRADVMHEMQAMVRQRAGH